jgi:hypothetical protein
MDALIVFGLVVVTGVLLAVFVSGEFARAVWAHFGVVLLIAVGTVIYLGLTGHLSS